MIVFIKLQQLRKESNNACTPTTNKNECKFYCIELRRRRPRGSGNDIRVFSQIKFSVCSFIS